MQCHHWEWISFGSPPINDLDIVASPWMKEYMTNILALGI